MSGCGAITSRWLATVAALGAVLAALQLLPPFLREIAWTLVEAMLIAVGAYVVFVALSMRQR